MRHLEPIAGLAGSFPTGAIAVQGEKKRRAEQQRGVRARELTRRPVCPPMTATDIELFVRLYFRAFFLRLQRSLDRTTSHTQKLKSFWPGRRIRSTVRKPCHKSPLPTTETLRA